MAETLNVHQELIPLSDIKYDKPISQNQSYTNPVIMPFAFNATGTENIMETVFYIKNSSQEWYYTDVVICLMKGTNDGNAVNGTVNLGTNTLTLNGKSYTYEDAYENSLTGTKTLTNKYLSTYTPVVDDGIISVKMSYGYDELSYVEWANKKSIIYLPQIGTVGQANTEYIPVRMRITWKAVPSALTIRDYFIDVSYKDQIRVTG